MIVSSKKRKKISNKKNTNIFLSKAFTLIELLAVILILGLLLLIGITSVTKYISDTRRSTYIATAKRYIESARNLVNDREYNLYDFDTTYYIPISCIPLEKGGKSPYGDFKQAYVIVSYTGDGFEYYWASTDTAKMGINQTDERDLSVNRINEGIDEIDTNISMLPDNNVMVFDKNTCKSTETKRAISSYFPKEKDSFDLYDIQFITKQFDFSNLITYYKKPNGAISSTNLSRPYTAYGWDKAGNTTFYLFSIINDSNLKRNANFEISLPIIKRKDTGEQVSIEKWYYDCDIDFIMKEHWYCSGTSSNLSVSCNSEEDIYAVSTSKELPFKRERHLYLYLSDGNYIEIPLNKARHSYLTSTYYNSNGTLNYMFPSSFLESSYY